LRQNPTNIVGFSASPRPLGSTAWVVGTILEGARDLGARVCSWSADRLDLQPCRACFACKTKDRRCVVRLRPTPWLTGSGCAKVGYFAILAA
jgi:multimeric flavodoxin WrbA